MDMLRNARQTLSRRQGEANAVDLEQQQQQQPTGGQLQEGQSQMSEQPSATRPSPVSSVLRRFADMPRPSLRLNRQASTQRPNGGRPGYDSAVASPKSPPMYTSSDPSTHSWPRRQQQSQQQNGIAEPAAAVTAQHISDSRTAVPAEPRSEQHHQHQHQQQGGGAGPAGSDSAPAADKPRKFLFCLPAAKSRRLRALIQRSVISGSILSLMATVFLTLLLTRNVYNSEFAVLLVLMVLGTAAYFAHSIVRVVLFVRHPPTAAEEQAAEELYQQRRRAAAGVAGSGALGGIASVVGPGGYAIPHEPIQVVLARDEEAAGVESVTTKTLPPAYGLWRETVRVDPNRIYWQRNEQVSTAVSTQTGEAPAAPGTTATSRATSSSSSSSSDDTASSAPGSPSERNESPRPPSYMSDDGVDYVVEAQPRSTAPTTEVPLSHPAEAGRTGRPPAW